MGKPEGYEEVADRIHRFYEKHPDGRVFTKSWEVVNVGQQVFIVVEALVFTGKDDALPGKGIAWEQFPGRTPFTRGTELMNAETSAWGRALASIGLGGKRIATVEEIKEPVTDSKVGDEFIAWAKRQNLKRDDLKLALTAMGVSVGNKLPSTVIKTLTDDQIVSLKERMSNVD